MTRWFILPKTAKDWPHFICTAANGFEILWISSFLILPLLSSVEVTWWIDSRLRSLDSCTWNISDLKLINPACKGSDSRSVNCRFWLCANCCSVIAPFRRTGAVFFFSNDWMKWEIEKGVNYPKNVGKKTKKIIGIFLVNGGVGICVEPTHILKALVRDLSVKAKLSMFSFWLCYVNPLHMWHRCTCNNNTSISRARCRSFYDQSIFDLSLSFAVEN